MRLTVRARAQQVHRTCGLIQLLAELLADEAIKMGNELSATASYAPGRRILQ
jgi:hypothetical protein